MTPKEITNRQIALCVTCVVDQVYPEIGVATVKVLRQNGYSVAFPESQTCCGQPFFNSGHREEAVRLAKRTIEIFEPYDTVVLPSGSCTAMIRVEYPHLLEADPSWHTRALSLASKTFELTEFLSRQSVSPPHTSNTALKVSYHDSCHMCRALGLKDEPRAMLRQTGYELIEMAESDRCCGFGGLFSVKMPEVSNAMSREKLKQAEETGAQILVTSDPGCLMQLRGFAADTIIQIEHIAVLLANQQDGV